MEVAVADPVLRRRLAAGGSFFFFFFWGGWGADDGAPPSVAATDSGRTRRFAEHRDVERTADTAGRRFSMTVTSVVGPFPVTTGRAPGRRGPAPRSDTTLAFFRAQRATASEGPQPFFLDQFLELRTPFEKVFPVCAVSCTTPIDGLSGPAQTAFVAQQRYVASDAAGVTARSLPRASKSLSSPARCHRGTRGQFLGPDGRAARRRATRRPQRPPELLSRPALCRRRFAERAGRSTSPRSRTMARALRGATAAMAAVTRSAPWPPGCSLREGGTPRKSSAS